jgi:hypothetical protein
MRAMMFSSGPVMCAMTDDIAYVSGVKIRTKGVYHGGVAYAI